MSISTKQKQTHRYREWICCCQGGGGWGGKDWEFGISKCNLLYRMDKKQSPTVQHGELYSISCCKPQWKRIGKKCKYICGTESLHCTAEINTTLQINYTSINFKI